MGGSIETIKVSGTGATDVLTIVASGRWRDSPTSSPRHAPKEPTTRRPHGAIENLRRREPSVQAESTANGRDETVEGQRAGDASGEGNVSTVETCGAGFMRWEMYNSGYEDRAKQGVLRS